MEACVRICVGFVLGGGRVVMRVVPYPTWSLRATSMVSEESIGVRSVHVHSA